MEKIQYLKLHKNITQDFWLEFGPHNKGTTVSLKPKEETLAALIQIGTIELKPSPKARTPEYNRKQYVKFKSKLKGYNGFVLCFCCGARAQVRHHIIWIRNGGRNHKRNIVPLCRDCHAEIHPWLKTGKV